MLRKALAIVGLLITVPVLGLGAKFLYYLARLHFVDPYHVHFRYGSEAATWLIWSGLTALCFAAALKSKKVGGALALLAGWGLLLLVAIAIPSHEIDPLNHASFATEMNLRGVQSTLNRWAGEHGHLPASQAELDAVLKDAEATDPEKPVSPFDLGAQRLPFRVEYVGGAQGPVLVAPESEEPGVVLCAVNSKLDHYWLSATALAAPVGGMVVMEHGWDRAGEGPAVLDGPPRRKSPRTRSPSPPVGLSPGARAG